VIRLVATDIDGTLLRSDGTLSPATVATLRSLAVPYVLVTGRPRRWLEALVAELGAAGTAIAVNGALTYDLATGDVVRTVALEPAEALACAEAIRAAVPDTLFAIERDAHDSFAREPGYPTRGPLADATELPLAELLAAPVLKLLCRSFSLDTADALYEAATRACTGHPVELTHSSGTIGLLEISAAGVDKATALAAHAAMLGIAASDVLALGDGFNDVPMLTWAGWGVAVANAHPAALAVADEVTASNDDDGVARVLARL
jgi:Cof subfamily protein (haloacid dehalogenase superfamily)